jgi:ribosomal-protein-serine acetyltransferase
MLLIVDNDIKLKEISLEDVKSIYEIINSEREYLREWLPFVDETRNIIYTRSFVENYLNSDRKDLTFCVLYQNKMVGLVGMKDTDKANRKTEIGYWLSESYQHLGIITKSCRTLINYIFEELRINRIQLTAATENSKSQRVALRLGFQREGIQRDGELHRRGFVDLVVFSLLKKDWNSAI